MLRPLPLRLRYFTASTVRSASTVIGWALRRDQAAAAGEQLGLAALAQGRGVRA